MEQPALAGKDASKDKGVSVLLKEDVQQQSKDRKQTTIPVMRDIASDGKVVNSIVVWNWADKD